MFSSGHSASIVAAAASAALRRRRPSWLAALHAPQLPLIAAVLALLGLLFAFQHVVRAAVQQGESRRLAVAAQEDSLWRCNALRDRAERNPCRLQLRIATDAGARANARANGPEPGAAGR